MLQRTFVIVGAGLAGATAAEALRAEGFDGRIVLLGEERHRPYERPELSKRYLRGEGGLDLFVHAPGTYAEAGIELRTGKTVERIDVAESQVIVDGEEVPFDRLVLATGAAPRRLLVPGAELDGVITLRTLDDAEQLRQRAASAGSIVVVGGGWIGSEVAASLRQLGHRPTLVVSQEAPLQRVLGPEVSAAFATAHRRHGTRVLAGRSVVAVEGRERVSRVRLDDGSAVPADLVIVGIGARARDDLAAGAGLAMADGVLVDERLETSVPGIFAAGDVASAFHPRYGEHVRVEHWDNAKRQGRVAAANMLGRAAMYDRVPYFFSEQYDLSMEYVGHAPAPDRVVFRGNPDDHAYLAFWLNGGRVVAGMQVNSPGATKHLRTLVSSDAAVDADHLADAARPLDELVAPPLAA